jgi:ammonia channel protein AmtB
MRYSTYVLLQGLITGIVFLVFATVFLAIGGSAVIGLVALLAVLLGIGFGLSVAWAHRAVVNFSGSPFPGILGVLGVEIVPDEWPSAQTTAIKERYWVPGSSAFPPAIQGKTISDGVNRHGCTKCGGVTDGSDSKYCRLCGAPLGQ